MQLSIIFTKEENSFLKALARIESEVKEQEESPFAELIYSKIFSQKSEALLAEKDFKDKIAEYTKVYDNLLSSSRFFRKGVFNHYQAAEIAKQLKEQGFFKAQHSISLKSNISNDSEKVEVTDEAELENIINQDKDSILNNSSLQKAFGAIDKKLSANKELREFREYVLSNQSVIAEFANIDLFKEKLWKGYLVKHRDLFMDLMEEYNKGKDRIKDITQKASEERTKWQEVIDIFNSRFSVPFKVSIENKEDVILKKDAPNIRFEFIESEQEAGRIEIDRSQLISVLSNGERRALYLLNVIFEIQARKEMRVWTLFIIDDIADSFDYKNKYAIVEYLNEILSEPEFFQIILTHNFDFYRTLSKRLELGGNLYHVIKTKDNQIILQEEKQYKDIFKKWKEGASDTKCSEKMIALIPFVRNLAEYCGFDSEYEKLTALLHIKENTKNMSVKDLQEIYRQVLRDKDDLVLPEEERKVLDVVYSTAEEICRNDQAESIELEKKIVLSIAIRLKAEEYIIDAIKDEDFVRGLKGNQTAKLVRRYKQNKATDLEAVKVIERVNLMTPENIHLNSFMYEPILDMSKGHLCSLFHDVLQLTACNSSQ